MTAWMDWKADMAMAYSCVEDGANAGMEVGPPVGAESTGDLAEGG